MLRLIFCVALLVPLASIASPAQDEAFLAAREAFAKGQAAKFEKHAEGLDDYVLTPYIEYYRLRMGLDGRTPDEVRIFLARHDGTVLGDRMRSDWLKALGKQQSWDLFQAERAKLVNDDPEVSCYWLQGRQLRGDASVASEFKAFWTSPRDLPDGCQAVADTLVGQGRVSSEQVWARVRLLLEAGQMGPAKRTINYLPAAETPNERALDSIRSNPRHYLDHGKPDLSKRVGRELALFGVLRLSRTDAGDAASIFEKKLASRFGSEDRAYAWGRIATNAARQHHPMALEWFARAGAAPLDDEQLAWLARAALREGRWPDVLVAIERMTPLERNDPTWVYWQGRALLATGKRIEGEALFARIADEHEFYGKLAREELGLKLDIPPRGYTPGQAEVDEMAKNAGLQRALKLFELDLRIEGIREWNWTIRGMDDRQLLAAAEVARRREVWDRAINTANRTVGTHDFSMRFLAPYREVFRDQAAAQGLEESWVLGLVRQESRFIVDAKSSAGARGLMQLMPSTARWIAKRVGLRDFSLSQVSDVAVNVTLGTSYLRHVYDDLDGSEVLAAAAYNAGPGRAKRWRGPRDLEGAIYVESIPFNETRDYVKKVMSNTMYYAALLGGDTRPLKSRLGVIPANPAADRVASSAGSAVE